MDKIYRVICEWDIGQDDQMFLTKERALEYAENQLGEEFQEFKEDGLVYVESVPVVS